MNIKTNKDIFLEVALRKIPFILSLQDRNPFSPTYGSFDREYWQYKKTDTPYASVQSAVFSLALLYKNKLPKNPYYNNENVLEWIIAGLKFLVKIQKKDGGFDEYYPNECSYIGTAIVTYPWSETFKLIKDKLKTEDKEKISNALKKAAKFLSERKESNVLNQEMASTLAIYSVNQIFNYSIFNNIIEKKLRFVLQKQKEEGWFPEYGGCDVGYLSYTIDFMATYYKKTADKRLVEPLKKAINFISYFLHPDGTVGGEYTARNTEYLVPHGFELMNDHPLSNRIIKFLTKSLNKNSLLSLESLDSRYLPLYLHQYIQTFLESSRSEKVKKLPYERKRFIKYFKEAGIYIKKNKNFYILVGLKKGGVIRIYDCKRKKIVFSNCGYIIKDKKILSSTYFDNDRPIKIKNNIIVIEGKFYNIDWYVSTVKKHILLRLILFNRIISKHVRELIKFLFITRKNIKKIFFKRIIIMDKKNISIKDTIKLKRKVNLFSVDKFSFRYIPSSRFFQKQELNFKKMKFEGFNKKFKFSKHIRI